MVGSAIQRKLSKLNYNLLTPSSKELDLRDQKRVLDFFLNEKPDHVYLAAAKVGGINANNSYPAQFIHDNLVIQSNVIHSSWVTKVNKLLFLGSSCIYPKLSNQPINERELLSGKLEDTNEPYAIAKIAGIKMCESYNRQYGTDFRSVMPTNLYGENDNYDLNNSHVIPALIRKIDEAKIKNKKNVELWGTGAPYREFMHVDDLADACHFIMSINKNRFDKLVSSRLSHINIGSQKDISINELAHLIAKIIGYCGKISFNPSMPDGVKKKLMDSSKLYNLGWKPSITLEKGLEITYKDYKNLKLNN
tara:strand:+ start:24280 stop:25197 length:918 start_codon:yes stop_codon:yes gene_type:complete